MFSLSELQLIACSFSFLHELGALGLAHMNKRLYVQLTRMITELLSQRAQTSPETEAAFLEFVSRTEYYVQKRAKCIHNALLYFNSHWVRWEIDEGKLNVFDVFELHRSLVLTSFLSNVQGRVRANAFKFILNGGSLNCATLQCPVIRDLISSRGCRSRALPKLSSRRRPIYLLSRRLDQLVPISRASEPFSRENGLSARPSEVFQPQLHELSVFATWMATFDHWGVLIGPRNTNRSKLPPWASGDNCDRTSSSSLLCELRALKEDDGYVSAFVGAPEGWSFDNSSLCLLKGYTSYSDDKIRDYGECFLSHKDSKIIPYLLTPFTS